MLLAWMLVFVASTDHNATDPDTGMPALERYVSHWYRDDGSPVDMSDHGKPVPDASNEIVIPVDVIVEALSPGTYYVEVEAIGPNGMNFSLPSAPFTLGGQSQVPGAFVITAHFEASTPPPTPPPPPTYVDGFESTLSGWPQRLTSGTGAFALSALAARSGAQGVRASVSGASAYSQASAYNEIPGRRSTTGLWSFEVYLRASTPLTQGHVSGDAMSHGILGARVGAPQYGPNSLVRVHATQGLQWVVRGRDGVAQVVASGLAWPSDWTRVLMSLDANGPDPVWRLNWGGVVVTHVDTTVGTSHVLPWSPILGMWAMSSTGAWFVDYDDESEWEDVVN